MQVLISQEHTTAGITIDGTIQLDYTIELSWGYTFTIIYWIEKLVHL